MGLSNQKRKRIRRLAAEGKRPRRIAEALDLPLAAVEEALGIEARSSFRTAFLSGGGPDRVFFYAALAAVFLAPLAIAGSLYDAANLPQAALVQCSAAALAWFWFLRAAVSRETSVRISGVHLPLALFVAWSGLSAVWCVNRGGHAYVWSQWAACAALFVVFHHHLRTGRQVVALLAVLFAGGCAVAAIGIAQHLFGFDLVAQVAPPAATFVNKNCAAQAIVPATALGGALFLRAARPARQWLCAVATTLLIAYLFYTGARAGWAAFAAQALGCCVLLGVGRKRGVGGWARDRLAPLATCTVLLLALVHLTPSGFEWTLTKQIERTLKDVRQLRTTSGERQETSPAASRGGEQGAGGPPDLGVDPERLPSARSAPMTESFAGRALVWRDTLSLIRAQALLGVGVGNLQEHFAKYDGSARGAPTFTYRVRLENAHNDYLQAWSETGVVGIALLVWLGAALALALKRLFAVETEERALAAGAALALLGMAVNAAFSSPFQKAIPPLYAACLAASATALLDRHGTERRVFVPAAGFRILAGMGVVGLILLVSWEGRRFRCDRLYQRMSAAAKSRRWEAVIRAGGGDASPGFAHRRAQALLGKAHLELGSPGRALEHFDKHLALHPNDPIALFDAGVAHAALGRHGRALEHYARVEALLPAYPGLHNNIGAVCVQQKRFAEALEHFRIEAALGPDDAEVWFNLGMAFMAQERYAEAAGAFRWVVKLRPDWGLACRQLGAVLSERLGRQEEGAEYLERASRLEAEN